VKGKDVKRIRAKLKMSQSEFSTLLGVPAKTLQAWEHDRQEPRSSAVALLKLADSGALTKRKR
jgi:putative transcriptional regulator